MVLEPNYDYFVDQLLVAQSVDDPNFWIGDACNESTELWLAGCLDTDFYLDQFDEFGDVDYHVERMQAVWDYWGLL